MGVCVCGPTNYKIQAYRQKKSATATPTHNRRYKIYITPARKKIWGGKKMNKIFIQHNKWMEMRANKYFRLWLLRSVFPLAHTRAIVLLCCCCWRDCERHVRSESGKCQNEWASSILKTLIFIELSIGVDRFRLRNIFWRIMLSIQITKASAWADNVSVREVFFSLFIHLPKSSLFFCLSSSSFFWLDKFSERIFFSFVWMVWKTRAWKQKGPPKIKHEKIQFRKSVRKQKQQQQQQEDKKNF